jgi:hypothetical protein
MGGVRDPVQKSCVERRETESRRVSEYTRLNSEMKPIAKIVLTNRDHVSASFEPDRVTVQVPRPVGVSRTPREDAGKNFAHGAENVADAEGTR